MKNFYAFFVFSKHVTYPAHAVLLGLITVIMFGEDYK